MKFIFIITLTLGLITSLPGNDRTFRVLYLNAPAKAPKQIHVFDGKGFQQIALPKMNFSEVYKLPSGPLTLRFFESIPNDFEGLPPLAPSVQIPEGMTDFYLLISNDPENTILPIKAFPVSAGNDQLQRGQMLWFNMTENQIAGELGTQKFMLRPSGKNTTNAPTNKAEQYKVTVFYKLPESELAYPFLVNTFWRHDPRSKSVAFVIPQQGKRNPRIMVFRDFR